MYNLDPFIDENGLVIICCRLLGQKMDDLPSDRMTPWRPFLQVSLDYLGSINLKQWGKRSIRTTKAWVSLFVYLTTKAIDLDIVSDLTSNCFINALKGLVIDERKVYHIYCYNVKTFNWTKKTNR